MAQRHAKRPVPVVVFAAIALLLTLVSHAGARAQQALPLTLESIFGPRNGVRSVEVSPDGRWIAMTGRTDAGAGIHVLAAHGQRQGRPVPAFLAEGGSPAWAPDNRRIVYVQGGDVRVVSRGGGEPRVVVTGMQGVRAPSFSPDGSTIAFYATDSGHQDIWVVPADGRTRPRQLTSEAMAEDHTRYGIAWSPDGRQIAFISNRADYWADDIWLVDVASGRARQLTRSVMAQGTPVWSPDGSRLAVYGTRKQDFWYHDLLDIFVVDVSAADGAPTRMAVDAAGDGPVWSADGALLYYPRMQRGDYDVWSAPLVGGVPTRVTHLGGRISGLDAPADASSLVFVRSGPTDGPEVYHVSAAGGVPRQLTSVSPAFAGVRMPQEVSFRSFDGMYIQGFLYLPPGFDRGGRYPALVQVHGGGTNSYVRSENLVEQYLSSQGYVVLAVNYRGGSGFGRPFQDLSFQDWLNGQARDAGAAADFLRALPYTNGRVGIYGGSYGGMTTMGAITRTPDKFDAAVPMRGIYSASRTFEHLDRVGKIFVKTGQGGLPSEQPEAYAVADIIDRIDRIEVPVLIMHGEADARAPFLNYELAVEALRRHGKRFESRSYPGEGHGFRDPANLVDMYSRLEEFFDRHLRN